MSVLQNFGTPVTCHAFSPDCTQIALSLNNNQLNIYKFPEGNSPSKLLDVLDEHTAPITGVDWGIKTNRIVTCASDRNAYVWTLQQNKWKPVLVILQINRAATCVSWSPLENKFAVGSASRMISVCYFEEEQNWWVSKQIKKPIRSTITCLDWHPNNVLLGAGSTDFRARVFSAFMKTVDGKPAETTWGDKLPFQKLLFEYMSSDEANESKGGWIHSVSFSKSGDKLAWVSHNSTVSVVDSSNNMAVTTIRHDFLPLVTCEWIAPATILTAGHDCCPMIFSYQCPNSLKFVQQLDIKREAKSERKTAIQKFQEIDRFATSDDVGKSLETIHQNTITEIRIVNGDKSRAIKFSTIGKDGRVIIWDLPTLEQRLSGLQIR